MDDRRKTQIIKLFREHGCLSYNEVSAALGEDYHNSRRWVLELEKEGYLVESNIQSRRGSTLRFEMNPMIGERNTIALRSPLWENQWLDLGPVIWRVYRNLTKT